MTSLCVGQAVRRELARSLRDTRGGNLVEYIALLGLVAVAAFTAYTTFGGTLRSGASLAAERVARLEGGQGGGVGSSGSCANGLCTNGTNCFVAGTLVATPNGPVPIEGIHEGDAVLSRDEHDDGVVVSRVAETFVTSNAPLVDVRVEGGDTVRATPGHPFFTRDRGFVEASRLTPGEELVTAAGAVVHVVDVTDVAARATVFNFEVARSHTYFVGAQKLWVHNPTNCDSRPASPAPPTPGGHGAGTSTPLGTTPFVMSTVPAGTSVFHATSFEHTSAIVEHGIQPVPNAWEGGELGSGFYTASSYDNAANYLPNGNGAVLEFKTKVDMSGPSIPGWDPNQRPPSGDHPYFTTIGDSNPISQYKFNHGSGTNNLELVGIHFNGRVYTKEEYEAMF